MGFQLDVLLVVNVSIASIFVGTVEPEPTQRLRLHKMVNSTLSTTITLHLLQVGKCPSCSSNLSNNVKSFPSFMLVSGTNVCPNLFIARVGKSL